MAVQLRNILHTITLASYGFPGRTRPGKYANRRPNRHLNHLLLAQGLSGRWRSASGIGASTLPSTFGPALTSRQQPLRPGPSLSFEREACPVKTRHQWRLPPCTDVRDPHQNVPPRPSNPSAGSDETGFQPPSSLRLISGATCRRRECRQEMRRAARQIRGPYPANFRPCLAPCGGSRGQIDSSPAPNSLAARRRQYRLRLHGVGASQHFKRDPDVFGSVAPGYSC